MAPAEAKVTSKGQITLPSRVRAQLKVGPGDSVVFVEGNDGKITDQFAADRARSAT